MNGYSLITVLLAAAQDSSFNPTPIDELKINIDIRNKPQVKRVTRYEPFAGEEEVNVGPIGEILPAVIGGVDEFGNVLNDTLVNYNAKWIKLDPPGAPMAPRQGSAAANLNGILYLAGGKQELETIPVSPVLDTVLKLTGGGNSWVTDSYLNQERIFTTLTAVEATETTLMVTGGHGLHRQPMRTTEIYNPGDHIWNNSSRMVVPRYGHAAASLASKLYVLGGHGGQGAFQDTLKSTEVFDFATWTWSPGPSMNERREFHAAAVLDEQIYICGGFWLLGAPLYLESCERLDQNGFAAIGNMRHARSNFGMLVVGGQIWAIGGYNSISQELGSVEKYDRDLNLWNLKPNLALPQPRILFGAATVTIDIGRFLSAN